MNKCIVCVLVFGCLGLCACGGAQVMDHPSNPSVFEPDSPESLADESGTAQTEETEPSSAHPKASEEETPDEVEKTPIVDPDLPLAQQEKVLIEMIPQLRTEVAGRNAALTKATALLWKIVDSGYQDEDNANKASEKLEEAEEAAELAESAAVDAEKTAKLDQENLDLLTATEIDKNDKEAMKEHRKSLAQARKVASASQKKAGAARMKADQAQKKFQTALEKDKAAQEKLAESQRAASSAKDAEVQAYKDLQDAQGRLQEAEAKLAEIKFIIAEIERANAQQAVEPPAAPQAVLPPPIP